MGFARIITRAVAPVAPPKPYDPTGPSPPTWNDIFVPWNRAHIQQYGVEINRAWNSDVNTIREKASLDSQWQEALTKYNQIHGTNYEIDPAALGQNAQLNAFTPPKKKKSGIGGSVIGGLAGFALAPFTGGSSLLLSGLGGAIGGGVQTGKLSGALRGGLIGAGIGGGLSSLAGLAKAAAPALSAADIVGLQQMGQAAGLSGAQLQAFVQSGGTLGSTAAGGGGIGLGALSSLMNVGAGAPVVEAGMPASAADIARFHATSGLSQFFPAGTQAPAPVVDLGVPASAADIARIGAGGASAAGTALSRIFNQLTGGADASSTDWLSVLGTAGATGLDLLGQRAQAKSLSDIFNRFEAKGAPSLARFEGSFAPGFNLFQPGSPEQLTMDTAAQSLARAASAKYGNPADSPTAMAEINKYLLGNVGLPALNAYRSLNLTGAGLGTNVAGTAALTKADFARSPFVTLAGTLGDLTTPRSSLENLRKELQLMIGGARA